MLNAGGPPAGSWAFDGWIFHPASGELWRSDSPEHLDADPDAPSPSEPLRLQPQPAQILEILLARSGQVVSRDELVEAVWSETKVEFDQGLNYCVRQIRIALDESATEPRYLETLPRRGYRFLQPAAQVPPQATSASPRRRVALRSTVAAILLAAGLAGALWIAGSPPPDPAPVLAVQVLRAGEGGPDASDEAIRVAELLTAELTGRTAGRVRVIGPTTTAAFGPERLDVRDLRDELGARWVVGGSVTPSRADGLFLELVDTRDFAHLWAAASDPADPASAAAAADSIVGYLLR